MQSNTALNVELFFVTSKECAVNGSSIQLISEKIDKLKHCRQNYSGDSRKLAIIDGQLYLAYQALFVEQLQEALSCGGKTLSKSLDRSMIADEDDEEYVGKSIEEESSNKYAVLHSLSQSQFLRFVDANTSNNNPIKIVKAIEENAVAIHWMLKRSRAVLLARTNPSIDAVLGLFSRKKEKQSNSFEACNQILESFGLPLFSVEQEPEPFIPDQASVHLTPDDLRHEFLKTPEPDHHVSEVLEVFVESEEHIEEAMGVEEPQLPPLLEEIVEAPIRPPLAVQAYQDFSQEQPKKTGKMFKQLSKQMGSFLDRDKEFHKERDYLRKLRDMYKDYYGENDRAYLLLNLMVQLYVYANKSKPEEDFVVLLNQTVIDWCSNPVTASELRLIIVNFLRESFVEEDNSSLFKNTSVFKSLETATIGFSKGDRHKCIRGLLQGLTEIENQPVYVVKLGSGT